LKQSQARHTGVIGRRSRFETSAASRARTRDRAPATIKVDSKIYTVIDIGEAGLVVEPYDGDLVVKQRFYFELVIPVGDKDQAFRADATVIRVENKRLTAKFNELRNETRRAIQYVVAHRNAVIPGTTPAR
jgi:hypothetical protein